jgi:hypothetical protein
MREQYLLQNCVQCSFVNKSELSYDEVSDVDAFVRRHDRLVRGGKAFPQFFRYLPYVYPQEIESEQDQKHLAEALSAAIALSDKLTAASKRELGFLPIDQKPDRIPLLTAGSDGYTLDHIELPAPMPERYAEPVFQNEVAVAKIGQLPHNGRMACEAYCLSKPILEKDGEVPHYPFVLLCYNRVTEQLLDLNPVTGYPDRAGRLVEEFSYTLIREKIAPTIIEVRDERTAVLLRDFCQKTGIQLAFSTDLQFLDEIESDLFHAIGGNDQTKLYELIDLLSQLDEKEVRAMPTQIAHELMLLVASGQLPKTLADNLRHILQTNEPSE